MMAFRPAKSAPRPPGRRVGGYRGGGGGAGVARFCGRGGAGLKTTGARRVGTCASSREHPGIRRRPSNSSTDGSRARFCALRQSTRTSKRSARSRARYSAGRHLGRRSASWGLAWLSLRLSAARRRANFDRSFLQVIDTPESLVYARGQRGDLAADDAGFRGTHRELRFIADVIGDAVAEALRRVTWKLEQAPADVGQPLADDGAECLWRTVPRRTRAW